jgi:ParB-like chromosome segregation protein Spo0J
MTEHIGNISLGLLTFACVLGAVTSATQVSTSVRKPANWIKPLKQIREDYGTPEEQQRFGESVKARQLQPLVCLADGTLVCGYRRFVCGSAAGMTEFDVTVIADKLSESQIKVYRLTENIQRKDLTAWEMWQSCAELMCMNPTWQQSDLASHLHYDASTISRYLSPSRCIEAAQTALREGKIGITDCAALSKIDAADQPGLLAMKLSGASRDTLEAAGRKARAAQNPGKKTPKAAKVTAHLPSGYTVIVKGGTDGVSIEDGIEAMADAIKEFRRAKDLGYTAKTLEAAMADKAKKG